MNHDQTQPILSVSELNAYARALLEQGLGEILIEGEISNLSQPSSGHCYFSLKDSNAQVRCAFFKMHRQRNKINLENGMLILVRAAVSLYEPRGDYQLIVTDCELAGEGLLQREFELLKKRLNEAGLFLETHKKPLPSFPQKIGIITSSTGAAVRDVLHILKRRFSAIPIIIYPAQVQGERAASQLIEAIEIANERKECEVLILTRGGGSLEDLWCFNNEKLAYAIFNSEIPIVTGIGHEVDFTIADFVADCRAPTPSAAAELVTPNANDYQKHLVQFQQRLVNLIHSCIRHSQSELKNLEKRLTHPRQQLEEQAQSLDLLEQRLNLSMRNYLQKLRLKLQTSISHLDAISPLNTLKRGYALITKVGHEEFIRNANELKKGDLIEVQFSTGKIQAEIV